MARPIILNEQLFKRLVLKGYFTLKRVGNVDPGGPVSLQSLAPALIKHTWSS